MLGLAVAAAASLSAAPPAASLATPPAIVHGLGYAAGFTSGVGFHYRQFRDDGWGWGVTAAAGFTPDNGNGAASIGVEAFKTIFLLDWGRFYWVGAIGRFQQITRFPGAQGLTNLGPGLGIDFGPIKGVNLAVEVPYTLFFDTNYVFQNAFPAPNAVMTYQF